ncbi:hypothetical protein D3C81_1476120 [compost metagenome]
MTAGVSERDLLMLQRLRFETQPGQHVAQLCAKAHGRTADQVAGHAVGGITVFGPAQQVGLAFALTVEGLELLRSRRLWCAQQQPFERAAVIVLAQHPKILQLGAVQRQGGGAQARIATVTQALDQLQVIVEQVPLQHRRVSEGDDTFIEHLLDGRFDCGPGLQLILQVIEVNPRLQLYGLPDQPRRRHVSVGWRQRRVIVGEGGVLQKLRTR